MGIADRLKDLRTKAVDATAEHSEKIHETVEKVATTADQRTGGKYHERIQQAGAKAGSFVDSLKGPTQQTGTEDTASAPADGSSASSSDAPAPATDAPAQGASQP